MKETKFTKGEWQVSGDGLNVNSGGCRVARAYSGSNIAYVQPARANAHLIAAAPEMYKLLEDYLMKCNFVYGENYDEVEELLKKARGEN